MSVKNAKHFDYTKALKALCCDICAKVPEFQKIDPNRIGYSFSVARNTNSRYGCWASMTPLLFENGLEVTVRERSITTANVLGRPTKIVSRAYFKAPKVKGPNGEDLLYVFNVMAPRFLDLSVMEKIETIMHELYHINPAFNGDVRRFPGRNWQHGNKAAYDAKAASLAKQWLAADPDPRLYDFLRYTLRELKETYGGVVGSKFTRIPLIRISEEEARRLGCRIPK